MCPPDFISGLHLAGAGTVLSGESALRPLLINNSAGAVTVLGLHFVAGVSDGPGGGLNIGAASVDLSFNRFDSNQATGAQGNGGGVAVAAVTGNINFSNNLLNGNQGTIAGAARLYAASGSSTIRNNTLVSNGTSTLSEPGGLKAEGPGSFDIQNNIFWNNHELRAEMHAVLIDQAFSGRSDQRGIAAVRDDRAFRPKDEDVEVTIHEALLGVLDCCERFFTAFAVVQGNSLCNESLGLCGRSPVGGHRQDRRQQAQHKCECGKTADQ